MGILHREHAKLRRDLQISLFNVPPSLLSSTKTKQPFVESNRRARNIASKRLKSWTLQPAQSSVFRHHRERGHVPVTRTASTQEIEKRHWCLIVVVYTCEGPVSLSCYRFVYLDVDHAAELGVKREFDKYREAFTGYFTTNEVSM